MKNYYLERAEEKQRKKTVFVSSNKENNKTPDEEFMRRCIKMLKNRKK